MKQCGTMLLVGISAFIGLMLVVLVGECQEVIDLWETAEAA